MKQKHFIDIQHIREETTGLKDNNIKCFEPGDIIQITEKFDGSCASASYDEETDSLVAFSRKQELAFNNTLNGFWNYVQNLDKDLWKNDAGLYCFGEWTNKNKIIYNLKEKHWLVYDVYDSKAGRWYSQDEVKEFAKLHHLEYINEKYYGPFISWEHCKSFMKDSAYGDRAEGIVVKNQTKLADVDNRHPSYLKIVNDDFKESMAMKAPEDPEVTKAKNYAGELTATIVTKARVEKALYKLRDEGVFPEKLTPQDMRLVAQNLPKYIYDDCVKEEPEVVKAVGEYFSKFCSSQAMKIARELICS